jgi:uncharacterized membrane protein YfbV (UPF0208 family)
MAQIIYIENMQNTLTNATETFLGFLANVVFLGQRVTTSLSPQTIHLLCKSFLKIGQVLLALLAVQNMPLRDVQNSIQETAHSTPFL